MKYADIEWQDGQAFSREFGDIYFSRKGGLQESQYVFLELNQLSERFSKCDDFLIGELGFGTGLNFLLAWKLFEQLAPPHSRLHFVSTEMAPVLPEDRELALSVWPNLAEQVRELNSKLSEPFEGIHRIGLGSGKVSLTLLYGEIHKLLPQLRLAGSNFDCWFLDGFAPQKNPAMWEEGLISLISSLSKQGASLSTYSVAGVLRRALEKNAWEIARVPGFGGKRESLRAVLSKPKDNPSNDTPWFSIATLQRSRYTDATVIGAGLAGCWAAHCLACRGISVRLIERHAEVARRASGNEAALALPYWSLEKSARHEFFLGAFSLLISQLREFQQSFEPLGYGVRHRLPRERIESFIQKAIELDIPHSFAKAQDEIEILYSLAAVIEPRKVCETLIKRFENFICLQPRREAIQLKQVDSRWRVLGRNGEFIAESDAVVIANSYDALELEQTSWMPLTKIRGELISVTDPEPLSTPTQALCGKTYLIPMGANRFLVGASYNQVFLDPNPSKKIQQELFEKSKEEFGVFSRHAKIENSRVEFRASSFDRLPYIGPLPDFDYATSAYKEYRKGFPPTHFQECQYLPGLFVSLGHGSRGVVSAPMAAEIVASFIAQEPLPVSSDTLRAILPMRWIIRELARGHSVQRQREPEAKF